MSTSLSIPQPGKDLIPDGWWKSTVVPWADEQTDPEMLRKGDAKLAALEAATKAMDLDAMELMKGRRYIELQWGKVLGKKDVGRGHKISQGGEILPKNDRHRFRQLASYRPQVLKRLEAADKEDQCTRTALLRVIKGLEKDKKKAEASSVQNETCTVDDLYVLADSGRKFSTVYADPPWQYDNQATRSSTDENYSTMTLEEIYKLPVARFASDNAHLHLWTTNAFLRQAFDVIAAWGFEYKSCFVWVKPQMGIGNYWRVSHEFLLLGVRGKCTFADHSLKSWASLNRGEHSAKPGEVRSYIERASPGPYIELFARQVYDGWAAWGNEIDKSKSGLFHSEVASI